MTTVIPYNIGEAIIAVFTIIGNSIVLTAICKYHHLHSVTNVFIGHLAAADFFNGLMAPIVMILALNFEVDIHTCVFLNSVQYFFGNVSIIMLFCVTCDRYVAVRYPFQYIQILDIPRANYIALMAWALGITCGLLVPIFGWHVGQSYRSKCSFLAVMSYGFLTYLQFGGLFLLPICLMMLMYGYIGKEARRHQRLTTQVYNRFNVKKQKNTRSVEFLVVLIAVVVVLKMPLHLLNFMKYFNISPLWISANRPTLILITVLLSRSNSLVNVFIYAGSNSKIKEAMLHLTLRRPMHTYKTSTPILTGHNTPILRRNTHPNPRNTAVFVSKDPSSDLTTSTAYQSLNSITENISYGNYDYQEITFINHISE